MSTLMPLPPPLKSSAAIRAASTEPMPLVSWKMPEMSLSTPTRTTLSEISAFAAPPFRLAASASVHFKFFIGPSPVVLIIPMLAASARRDGYRQAVEPAQRVVETALWLAPDLDLRDPAGQSREHCLAFEPRDQLTDAHVNT